MGNTNGAATWDERGLARSWYHAWDANHSNCCYFHDIDVAKALELRSVMEQCHVKLDVAAYNDLISGLCANGDVQAAFKLYGPHVDSCIDWSSRG